MEKEYDLVEYTENEGELKHYVGDYEFIQSESDTPKLVLTNTATPVLALQKVWDDNDNANIKRPSTVTLELYQEDALIHRTLANVKQELFENGDLKEEC